MFIIELTINIYDLILIVLYVLSIVSLYNLILLLKETYKTIKNINDFHKNNEMKISKLLSETGTMLEKTNNIVNLETIEDCKDIIGIFNTTISVLKGIFRRK